MLVDPRVALLESLVDFKVDIIYPMEGDSRTYCMIKMIENDGLDLTSLMDESPDNVLDRALRWVLRI